MAVLMIIARPLLLPLAPLLEKDYFSFSTPAFDSPALSLPICACYLGFA